METSQNVLKKAQETATNISQQTQQFTNTAAVKKVAEVILLAV